MDTAITKVVRFVASKSASASAAGGGAAPGDEELQIWLSTRLKVSVETYLRGRPPNARRDDPVTWFEWNESKYPVKRPLPEMVKNIATSVGKLQDDLKQLIASKDATEQKLNAGARKKGKFVLEDILTPDVVSVDDFVNTDYLVTLVVAVPKTMEERWLGGYEKLCGAVAGYGPEGNRQQTTGSPVVPGSSRKLVEKEDTVFFSVALLRGQYQAGFFDDEGQFEAGTFTNFVDMFIKEARESKFVAREFMFDAAAAEAAKRQTEQWKYQQRQQLTAISKFCESQFGEAFVALTHVKAIRAFVESVLRYGLPPNFTAVVLKPFRNKEKRLHETLTKMYSGLQGSSLFAGDDEPGKFSASVPCRCVRYALCSLSPSGSAMRRAQMRRTSCTRTCSLPSTTSTRSDPKPKTHTDVTNGA